MQVNEGSVVCCDQIIGVEGLASHEADAVALQGTSKEPAMEKTWTCPVCKSVFSVTEQEGAAVVFSAGDQAEWTTVCRSPEVSRPGASTRCQEVREALAALSGPEEPDL